MHVGETPGGIAIDVVDEGDGITGDLEAVFGRRGDLAPSTPRSHARPGARTTASACRSPARSPKPRAAACSCATPGPRPRFSLLLPAPDRVP